MDTKNCLSNDALRIYQKYEKGYETNTINGVKTTNVNVDDFEFLIGYLLGSIQIEASLRDSLRMIHAKMEGAVNAYVQSKDFKAQTLIRQALDLLEDKVEKTSLFCLKSVVLEGQNIEEIAIVAADCPNRAEEILRSRYDKDVHVVIEVLDEISLTNDMGLIQNGLLNLFTRQLNDDEVRNELLNMQLKEVQKKLNEKQETTLYLESLTVSGLEKLVSKYKGRQINLKEMLCNEADGLIS